MARSTLLMLTSLLFIGILLLVPSGIDTVVADDTEDLFGGSMGNAFLVQTYGDAIGDTASVWNGIKKPDDRVDIVRCGLAKDADLLMVAAEMVGDIDANSSVIFQCRSPSGEAESDEFIFSYFQNSYYITKDSDGSTAEVSGVIDGNIIRIMMETDQLATFTGVLELTLLFVNATLSGADVFDTAIYTVNVIDDVTFDTIKVKVMDHQTISFTFKEHHSNGSIVRLAMDESANDQVSEGEVSSYEEKLESIINGTGGFGSDPGDVVVDLDSDITMNGKAPVSQSVEVEVDIGSIRVYDHASLSITTTIVYAYDNEDKGSLDISVPIGLLKDISEDREPIPGLIVTIPEPFEYDTDEMDLELEEFVDNRTFLLERTDVLGMAYFDDLDRIVLKAHEKKDDPGPMDMGPYFFIGILLMVVTFMGVGFYYFQMRRDKQVSGDGDDEDEEEAPRGPRSRGGRKHRKPGHRKKKG